VADSYNSTIRKLAPDGANWVVSTIAGTPYVYGYADGTNNSSSFNVPNGIAADVFGNLYVADSLKNIVRQISPVGANWVVTTIGGSATNSSGYADGTNNAARFYTPWGIAADDAGNVFVTEYNNHTVRRGTLPALPVIRTTGRSGANITFTWTSISGRTYQVLYRTNLTQTGWSNLGGTVLATNTTMTTSDSIVSTARRYYRVALLP
jgi:hypothetical protein